MYLAFRRLWRFAVSPWRHIQALRSGKWMQTAERKMNPFFHGLRCWVLSCHFFPYSFLFSIVLPHLPWRMYFPSSLLSLAYISFCFSVPNAKMGGKEMPCVSRDAHKPPAQHRPSSSWFARLAVEKSEKVAIDIHRLPSEGLGASPSYWAQWSRGTL